MKRMWLYQFLAAGTMAGGILGGSGWAQAQIPCAPPCNPCAPGTIQDYYSPTAPQRGTPTPADAPTPAPAEEGARTDEGQAAPAPEAAQQAPSPSDLAVNAPSMSSFSSGLAAGPSSALYTVGGYIDDALVRTRVRLRWDSVDGGDSDRAEFLYGTYNSQAFGIGGVQVNGPALIVPRRIDYEEVATYLELALTNRFSVFAELPVRWNNVEPVLNGVAPGGDPSASGLADMNFGFKYGLRQTSCEALTFQFKVFAPTGEEEQLLGTGHASVQPGFLYQERLSNRLTLFGELSDWFAIGATEINDPNDPNFRKDFGGNVLRYGIGTGYDLCQSYSCGQLDERLTWVNEFVGWTVLDGFGYQPGTDINNIGIGNAIDMDGDTIVNFKTGFRYTHDCKSLYVGYGFAMTDDVWYDDILRVEWQRFF